MFERFNDAARAVVVVAQEQARGLGHTHIGTEHLLLALLASDGVAGGVLASAGVESGPVTTDIVRLVRSPGELSEDETEALKTIGINVDEVLSGIQARLDVGGPAEPGESPKRRLLRRNPRHIPFTPRLKQVLEGSLREALHLKDNFIGTEHLLLGLLRDEGGLAVRILTEQGHELDELRQRTIEARPQAA